MTAQCPSPRHLRPVWRRIPAMLALSGAVLMLGSAPADAGDPIRVGYVSTSLASTPIVVADAKGYFMEEGLDAALVGFESSDAIALAVASGDVDFGTTGVSNPFFVLGKAGSLKIIGGDTTEHAGFHSIGFIASNQAYAAGLKSMTDAAGHSFGLTQIGSPLHYSLAVVLEKYGLDLKQVRVIALQSNSNVASALIGGQVDAAIMSSANLLAVVNRNNGGQRLSWLDDEMHYNVALTGTVVSNKLAESRPESVRRFLAAFRRAAQSWDSAFVDANGTRADQPGAQEMIALVAKGLNQPIKVVIDGLNYIEPEARIAVSDVQRMVDWYEKMGMQKSHIDAKAMIEMRYAQLLERGALET
jgi:NitT/TauT family transport system substrate-binding protein